MWQFLLHVGIFAPRQDACEFLTEFDWNSIIYCFIDFRTLGVANVGGMCRPDKSCSVNEDNGITLAHTVTHELGHK